MLISMQPVAVSDKKGLDFFGCYRITQSKGDDGKNASINPKYEKNRE
jgi:hypothetical protein